ALGVDRISDGLPASVLTVVEDARRAKIGACVRRDASGLDDFESAFRLQLAVEVGHHRARDVVRLDGAQAGHRSENDAMVEVIGTDLRGSEQLSHDDSFESGASTEGTG